MTSSTSNQPQSPIKVAVLYGGASPEHSVSCVSAGAIMSHLDPQQYEVIPVAISRAGTWMVGTQDVDKLRKQNRIMPSVPEHGTEVQLSTNPARAGEFRYVTGERAGEIYAQADAVFPVLHGPNGEDGTIQGFLEMSGIAYVGPGVLASSAGMDKERTKNLLHAAGLPIGEQVVLHPGEELSDQEMEELGLPVFVKPARGGSSIGISRVDQWSDLAVAIELARQHDWKVIVEKAIVGDEVECGVLQRADGTLLASVPAKLLGTEDSDEGFYGFDTKYLDDVVTAEIPATLAPGMTEQVQEIARQTFRAMGCDGLTRVDFFVTENGPVINEVNTMPGFTPISMYPQVLEASGVGYAELLNELIQRALVAKR